MAIQKPSNSSGTARYIVLAVLVAGAFFGAYQFAQAQNGGGAQVADAATAPAVVAGTGVGSDPSASDPSAGGSGCACCGSTAPTANGVTGDQVEGAATVSGDVQKISVDLSKGYYEPNVITLKAGVPAEITFGQGSGCTGQVLSKDLNFFEDLTAGPKTVKIAALDAGEYSFSCGMEMVFGKIVVQ